MNVGFVKSWPGYSIGKDIFGAALGYYTGGQTMSGALVGAAAASQIGNKSPPGPAPPPPMADQNQLLQEQQLQEAKDAAARYGRAATILTGTGAASTTGDKLGP